MWLPQVPFKAPSSPNVAPPLKHYKMIKLDIAATTEQNDSISDFQSKYIARGC